MSMIIDPPKDNESLQTYVEDISLTYFGKPFRHRATFNNRLRTTGGRYHIQTHDLDFNPTIVNEFSKEVFLGIVKHELCHYHLHLDEKGYQHRDHDFKQLLKKVGGRRYTPLTEQAKLNRRQLTYQCTGCGILVQRQRRINTKKYVCRNCHSSFQLVNSK